MPTRITVEISDEGLPIVQAALDTHNDYLRREALTPELTLEQFVQKYVEDEFGISPKHIEAKALSDARVELQAKVAVMDLKAVQAMTAAAVDIGAKAEPIEDAKP